MAMHSVAKVPVIDQRAAEQMNLSVLKRMDPQVEELLATAGHVALYDFDTYNKRWSRKDVEGSLFLVKRRSQPRFQFVILNKKSAVATDTFVEDVHGGFQCEVQKPYVLYRNKTNKVVGIWFYNDADCERISVLLQRISGTFGVPSTAAAGNVIVPGVSKYDVETATVNDYLVVSNSNDSMDECFWDRGAVVTSASLGNCQQENLNQQDLQPFNLNQPGVAVSVAAACPGEVATRGHRPGTNSGTTPAGGNSNTLARLFSNMKLETAQGVTQMQRPMMAAVVSASSSDAAPVPLLTPQLLQQEAATFAANLCGDSAPGSLLLQGLQRGNHQHSQKTAVAKPGLSEVDIKETANSALRLKIADLLTSLAANDVFCNSLVLELKKAGLLETTN